MKKVSIFAIGILLLGLFLSSSVPGCSPPQSSKLKVVSSTSLIAQIVKEVGDGRVEIVNIIPPAQCPGHFDIKPSDIQKLSDADLFLLHGWQGEMFSQELIDSANNPDLEVVKIDIKGSCIIECNWMTPPVQLEATEMIASALAEADKEDSSFYQKQAKAYKDKIQAKADEIKAKLSEVDLSKVKVLCADMQADFIKWVGLNIVSTYGRPDSLTPQVVRELVDRGKEAGVSLVIDNLQSGKDAGKAIAEELGCKRVILSNFPGGFEGTETWEKAIERNIEIILNAIK